MDDKSKGLIETDVAHGTQSHTDAGSIGGVDSYFDDDGRPTALLSIAPNGGPSVRMDLHKGDTFELGSELWQVTKIDDPNTDYWTAVLTQLR